MKYLLWLLKAAIFFTLFAFALNNQHDATVNFFFGTSWRAPLVLVVLAAFTGGMVVGALGMLPGWWKRHKVRARAVAAQPGAVPGMAAGAAQPAQQNLPATTATATAGGNELIAARQHGL